jgi:UDP-glucose 4-epimerase
MRRVLVTGGLGYIGSHTCVMLAAAGCRVVIVDSLRNSKASALERIRELAPGMPVELHRADVRDGAALDAALAAGETDAVLHFAGLKSVAESMQQPALYHDCNVGGAQALLKAMARHGVRRLVFSSSATVYGVPRFLPCAEAHPLAPQSAYGRNKLEIEQLLAAEARRDGAFLYATLRYFNPIGAHPSARLGEDPLGIPGNLVPYLGRVALGQLPSLRIYGRDYDTPDGTGVRDYVHVMDVAAGHVAALQYLDRQRRSITANLGTGRGHSVLEVVRAFERVSGTRIPLELAARRPGDVAISCADASLAALELGWRARLDLDAMCRDAWRWQSQHPRGLPG